MNLVLSSAPRFQALRVSRPLGSDTVRFAMWGTSTSQTPVPCGNKILYVGSHYGTCFMLLFRHLEFWKMCLPHATEIPVFLWKVLLPSSGTSSLMKKVVSCVSKTSVSIYSAWHSRRQWSPHTPPWEPQSLLSLRGGQICQQSSSHLKTLGSSRMTWNKFYTEDSQILDATVKNSVARAIWRRGFLHFCPQYMLVS